MYSLQRLENYEVNNYNEQSKYEINHEHAKTVSYATNKSMLLPKNRTNMNKFIIILLGILTLFSEVSYSQVYLFDRDTTGIKEITEKTGKYKSSFKYDKSGYLTEIDYGYTKYTYNYAINDSLFTIYIHNYDTLNKICSQIYKYYLDLSGKVIRIDDINVENNDTILEYWSDNFVYKDKLLQGYERQSSVNPNYLCNNILSSKTVYFYNNNKKLSEKYVIMPYYWNEKIYNCDSLIIDTTFVYYIYDKSSNLTDCITDVSHTKSKYIGGKTVDKNANKLHIRYSNFDRHGNWTKSYFVTKKGKVFRSKRKIDYWETK
jgi:hypothetical protein